MKNLAILALIIVLTVGLVDAAGQDTGSQGVHEPGTGIENPEIQGAGQGTGLQDDGTLGQGEGQGIQDGGTAGQGEGQVVQTTTETQQQNQGVETQIQNQVRSKVQTGSYTAENGQQIQVQTQSNNRVQLKSGEAVAETSMEMTQEQTQDKTKLQVKLSNGNNAEVKVMPDTASERALESLRLKVCSAENGCQIELKEVGQGEQVKAAYEVQVQKQAKLLGVFKTRMQVEAQVDAENGEVIQTNKPWWAFLASETEE